MLVPPCVADCYALAEPYKIHFEQLDAQSQVLETLFKNQVLVYEWRPNSISQLCPRVSHAHHVDRWLMVYVNTLYSTGGDWVRGYTYMDLNLRVQGRGRTSPGNFPVIVYLLFRLGYIWLMLMSTRVGYGGTTQHVDEPHLCSDTLIEVLWLIQV